MINRTPVIFIIFVVDFGVVLKQYQVIPKNIYRKMCVPFHKFKFLLIKSFGILTHFVPNAPFLYPLKTENRKVALRVHWKKMG